MSEADFKTKQQKLIAMFDSAPIKHIFGMDLSYTDDNRAKFVLPYNRNFDHALDGIHGGAIATLADNAGWFTAAQYYDTWIATVEFQVRLLKHVKQQTLIATGKMVQQGKRIAVTEMEICIDDGTVVAIGSGTFVPTSASIEAW